MKKKPRQILLILFCLFNIILFTKCGIQTINITTVKFKTDSEKNEILEICLDKTLKKSENVFLVFNFKSKTNKTFRHEYTLYGSDKICNTLYVKSIFTQKFTSKEDQDFIDNHLLPGNINTMTIQIFNKFGGKQIFVGTYNDL